MLRLLLLLALYMGTSSAYIFREVGRPEESCTAVLVAKQGDHTIDMGLTCFLSDDTAYDVVVDDSFVQENFINGSNKSGEVEFDIPKSATIDNNTGTITIPDKSGIILRKKKGSEKASPDKNSQIKSVLAVRVVTTDATTSYSVEFLSDSVFGQAGDPVNLSTQTNACSHGALSYRFADARSSVDNRPSIVDGATTVSVNVASSAGDGAVRQAVMNELLSQFGVGGDLLADYVMYCMPAGVIPYIAYAYIGWYLSVYSNEWCTYPSSQMHEIGHNLGLSHSGEVSDEYGNRSCMMGYSYGSDDTPKMCYGAPKAWELGWYPTKRIELSESMPTYIGEIAGYIEDVNDDTVPPMLVKIIVDNSQIDYYLYYNRAAEFMSGTREGANTVMISKWNSNGYHNSLLQAKLSAGGSWSIPGFPGGSVVVNSIGTRANISISFGSSLAPSIDLSDIPSEVPSSMPSSTPSIELSNIPSEVPSSMPSISLTQPCYDSSLKLYHDGNNYSCRNLYSRGGCQYDLVQSHCPLSCNACLEYKCEDSKAGFLTNTGIKSCSDFGTIPEQFCELPKVFTTCREKCGICDV